MGDSAQVGEPTVVAGPAGTVGPDRGDLLAGLNAEQRAAVCHGDGAAAHRRRRRHRQDRHARPPRGAWLIARGADPAAHPAARPSPAGPPPRCSGASTASSRRPDRRRRRPPASLGRARLGRHLPRHRHPAAAPLRRDRAWSRTSRSSTAATPKTCMNVVRAELGLAAAGKRFPQKGTCLDIYSRCVNAQRAPRRGPARGAFPWCEPAEDELKRALRALRGPQGAAAGAGLRRPAALLARPARRSGGRRPWSASASTTCWSTSTRTPTRCRPRSCRCCGPTARASPCVGDDAQSIYAFRAATVRNILDFQQRFPGATVVTLEQNYRCTGADPRRHQRRHRRGRGALRQEPLVGARGRRPPLVRHLPRRGRADALALRTAPGAPRAGHAAHAPGRALPRPAPLHGAGAGAGAPQHPLPQVRRAALRRDGPRQGPHRLPAAGREPARRHGLPARAGPRARRRAQDPARLADALADGGGDFAAWAARYGAGAAPGPSGPGSSSSCATWPGPSPATCRRRCRRCAPSTGRSWSGATTTPRRACATWSSSRRSPRAPPTAAVPRRADARPAGLHAGPRPARRCWTRTTSSSARSTPPRGWSGTSST